MVIFWGVGGPTLSPPSSPSWANRPPISLRGILTYMPARAAYGIVDQVLEYVGRRCAAWVES